MEAFPTGTPEPTSAPSVAPTSQPIATATATPELTPTVLATPAPTLTSRTFLELQGLTCEDKGASHVWVTGEVKNISEHMLDNVTAVARWYTQDGQLVESDAAFIEYDLLHPGDISPFRVVTRADAAMSTCTIDFKFLYGRMIGTRLRE